MAVALKTPLQIQAANLRLFCKLDESSGNATDYSGNSYTLTDNGSVSAKDGFRQARSRSTTGFKSFDRAYSSASLLNFGNNANKSMTLFARIRSSSAYSTYHFLCDFVGGTGYSFLVNSGKLTYQMAGGSYVNGNTTLERGRWYDVCLTYDHGSTTAKLFLNGFVDKIVTGQAAPGAVSSGNFKLLNYPTNASGYGLIGEMEYFAAWDIALTPAEVSSLSPLRDIFGHDLGGEEHLRSSASVNVYTGQTFQVQTAGWFDAFSVYGLRNNSPTGNMTLKVYTDSAGSIGTLIATSNSIDVSLPNTTAGEIVAWLSDAVYLTAGTYWYRIEADYSFSSTVGIRLNRSSGGAGNYAGGTAKTYNGTSWSDISTDDFWFEAHRIKGDLVASHFLEAGTSDYAELYSNNNNEKYAQNINLAATKKIKGVAVWMCMYGSPSGNVKVNVYQNNSGSPGTLIDSTTAIARNIGYKTGSPSTRGNGGLWYFEFANAVELNLSTEYFIDIQATAGGSGANYNMVFVTSGSGYTSTYDLKKYNGGSWSTYSAGYDLQFALFEEISTVGGINSYGRRSLRGAMRGVLR